jgi:cell division protein ZapA (FtsZ GTPase activity inhibitor)
VIAELEKEREKNAALLQATTKLDKLVAELNISRPKTQDNSLDVAVLTGVCRIVRLTVRLL